MAELMRSRDWWNYEYGEEAVLVAPPCRGNRHDEVRPGDWPYDWTPKVGDRCRVNANRDGDHELLVVFETDSSREELFIWDGCIEPAAKPIPDDIDLTNPQHIEQFLKEDK